MMKKFFVLVTGFFCIVFFSFPVSLNAEWITGAYLGYSVSDDEDVAQNSSGFRQYNMRLDVDDSFILGYRLGYWLESYPWLGFSADISYFRPDLEDYEFTIFPLSPLIMFRIPLGADQEFPKGHFQPYIATGPGFFLSYIEMDNLDDSDIEIGWDARAGIAAMVAYNIAVFAEYRYTDAEFLFDDHISGIRNELEVDLDTHHFTIGVNYYF